MNRLEAALEQAALALQSSGARWAVIGGLAVSARAEPRTTRDVDIAVAVGADTEAEALVRFLRGRGYRLRESGVVENNATGRLATVRLMAPGEDAGGVVVDVMLDSSGIEPEIVAEAEHLEVFPGISVPVATTAHLLALKLLAGRAKDIADAASLLSVATAAEITAAHQACALITTRGCNRGRDLDGLLARLVGGLPIEVVG